MENNLNILIIDDHHIFRKGLESILRSQKYIEKILHANTGELAVSILKNHQVDVVFMDIRMPGEDGIQLTKRLLTLNRNLKIIALSMLDDRSTIIRMFRAGAFGYITKGTDSDQILESIAEVMQNHKYISSDLPAFLIDESGYDIQNNQNSVNLKFTAREQDILKLICQEYSNKDIARILGISVKGVEAYKSRLFDKTGTRNSTGLVKFIYEYHLINKL